MIDRLYKLSEDVFWRQYKDSIIAINHGTNEIILLNATGTDIFSFLSFPRAIQQIANFVKNKFEVEYDVAWTDASEFLSSLTLKGFVKSTNDTDKEFEKIQAIKSNKSYSENHEVMRWAAKNLIPVSAQIEITHRCNLQCSHCYLSNHSGNDIDISSFKKILQQLKD